MSCHYCGKKGHFKAECKKRIRDEKAGEGKAVALMAGVNISSSTSSMTSWLLDSGASDHMTHDMTHLDGYCVMKTPTLVELGDGTMCEALGSGSITIKTQGDIKKDIILRNVLYVPGLAFNLISVTSAIDAGASLRFTLNKCDIWVSGVTVATAHRAGGLYRLDFDPRATAGAFAATAAETATTWHRRFGHLGYESLATMKKREMVTGIKTAEASFRAEGTKVCEPCVLAKHQRVSFGKSTTMPTRRLEVIHMDLCGPLQEPSSGGSRYIATFLDGYSKLSVVQPIKTKSAAAEVVRATLNRLETWSGERVKTIRTDRGREYLNAELSDYLTDKGIVHQTTAPYTPEQNGAAERLNRTLLERARAMLEDADLPNEHWAEAVVTANYIRNRSITSASTTSTPWELFFLSKPDVSHMRIFGVTAYVHIPDKLRKKLDPKSERGIFVGYEANSKAYRVLVDGDIRISKSVVFDESVQMRAPLSAPSSTSGAGGGIEVLPEAEDSGAVYQDLDSDEDEDIPPLEAEDDDDFVPPGAAGAPAGDLEILEPEEEQALVDPEVPAVDLGDVEVRRYPGRQRKAPGEWYKAGAFTSSAKASRDPADPSSLGEPLTLEEALAAPDADQWRQAMDEEMASLMANKTWELSALPPGSKAIPCKWVYKIKRDSKGNVERYKARLVAKGFAQRPGIDFDEVWAPVSTHTTLRAFLATAAAEDYDVHQLDIKTAFLNGELEETIFMAQAPGYKTDNLVCNLKKSLYGLRQAPRAWHTRLKKALEDLGFQASDADAGLFIIWEGLQVKALILVYVDDMLIAAPVNSDALNIKKKLMETFEAHDMGQVSFFLGMEIERNRGNRTLAISQKKYTKSIVAKYLSNDAKTKKVPLSTSITLRRLDDNGQELNSDVHHFAALIGALLYLAVCTRPDIAQAVGALCRYMSCPGMVHWEAAKSVLRYVHGTSDYSINFGGGAGLIGYCDADYAGDVDTRRSTTGFAFMLNGGVITWSSRLQPTVAASTTEAEYMAAAGAVKEALWLRKLLKDLGYDISAVKIYCDNQGAIKLLKHPIAHARSKHIDVLHHFARERANRGEVDFEYCRTDEMVADCLTKTLPERAFLKCLAGMGIH